MWFLYRNRKFIIFLVLLLTIAGICFYFFKWSAQDSYLQYKYDLTHTNEPVYSQSNINKILKDYPSLSLNRLDKTYIDYTKSNTSKYKGMLSNSKYIVVPKSDIYRKIVGEFRIKHFMCKDKYYKDNSETHLNWLIDKALLYKTLELLQKLEQNGATGIYLTVHPDNPARHLYLKLGFEKVERIEDYYFDGEPRLVMRKKTNNAI